MVCYELKVIHQWLRLENNLSVLRTLMVPLAFPFWGRIILLQLKSMVSRRKSLSNQWTPSAQEKEETLWKHNCCNSVSVNLTLHMLTVPDHLQVKESIATENCWQFKLMNKCRVMIPSTELLGVMNFTDCMIFSASLRKWHRNWIAIHHQKRGETQATWNHNHWCQRDLEKFHPKLSVGFW